MSQHDEFAELSTADAASDEAYPTARPRGQGAVIFLLCFALFLLGMWLFAVGFGHANGYIFGAGILACTLAYLVPVYLGGPSF
ncbi:hypothetical protein ACGIF2_01845 [Cellulomonas sp. P22]|uniref:hypothetical protein n=1 Tax=Cellulomonas sp. P22 TaxID=3373189 RepID=UPI0037A62E7D